MTELKHLLIFFELLSHVVKADLSTTPRNQAVVVNSTVRLECGSNNRISQLRWSRGFQDNELISSGTSVRQDLNTSYQINNSSPGRFDLMWRAGMEDANIYKCEEPELDVISPHNSQFLVNL